MIFPREVFNRLLLLYFLSHIEGTKGVTRLQAIVFQVQKESRNKGWISRTFNYKFIRWTHGAYSNELNMDVNLLVNKGLLEAESYKVTEKAGNYLNSAKEISNLDLPKTEFLDLAKSLNQQSLSDLLLYIYEENRIRDYKMGKVLQDTLYTKP